MTVLLPERLVPCGKASGRLRRFLPNYNTRVPAPKKVRRTGTCRDLDGRGRGHPLHIKMGAAISPVDGYDHLSEGWEKIGKKEKSFSTIGGNKRAGNS